MKRKCMLIVMGVIVLIAIIAAGLMLISKEDNSNTGEITEDSKSNLGISNEKIEDEVETSADIKDIKIGDYIVYKPDIKEYITSGKENNGIKQSFKTTEVKWIYIGKDEKGNYLITSEEPIYNGEDNDLLLYGAGGYLYGEEELNAICSTLYSNNIGKARSMNLNDVSRLLNYNGPKGCYAENGRGETLTEEALKIGDIEVSAGQKIKRRNTPDGVTDISEYLSDCYVISETSDKISDEYRDYIYNSTRYWLATGSVKAELPGSLSGGSVNFIMRTVDRTEVGGLTLFISYEKPQNIEMKSAIRPVVEISSSPIVTKNSLGEWILK